MSFNFLTELTQNHGKKCLVIGDIVLDSYIFGKPGRISSEAPLPVIEVSKKVDDLGGGGNVIKNLVSFGFRVSAISVVGNDEAGQKIMSLLHNLGVDARVRVSNNKITSKKTRLIASGQQVARFDYETTNYEKKDMIAILKNDYLSALSECDIVIISDYERGVLSDELTNFVIDEAKKQNKPIVCDPRVKDFAKYSFCTIVTPNLKEASNALGEIKTDEDLQKALKTLKETHNIARPVITLSEKGIASFDDDGSFFISPAFGDNVVDVTGAGDTVVASFAFAIANGLTQQNSCIFANMAASMVVHKIGTHATNLEEIKQKFLTSNQYTQTNLAADSYLAKIVNLEQLLNKVNEQKNKKFVFTNGCFDILHRGHLEVISKAKSCGDLLIVGVNSDSSVKKLKGPTRPINNEQTRAEVLAALEFVDYVVIFSEDTPESLIKQIRPEVLVKGMDYSGNPQDLPGAKYVKKVEIFGTQKDETTSSSGIISKILKCENK